MMEEEKKEEQRKKRKLIMKRVTIGFSIAIVVGVVWYIMSKSIIPTIITMLGAFILAESSFIVREKLQRSYEVKKMEDVFPDFIELMASNLRAGMTIDKSLLLSSRKEFSPLDKEIILLGKNILTGKEIGEAMIEMARRTHSDKIIKTISIIISGIRSGGNLAILLEETAINMRERNFVEKRAASNVLMYLIFIFFAVGVGAPVLFSLSSVLVQVLSSLLKNIPSMQTTAVSLPFTLTSVNISETFVVYFSLTFVVGMDILASLLLGLVGKGEAKQGLKYTVPIILLAMGVFFLVRIFLTKYFAGIIG